MARRRHGPRTHGAGDLLRGARVAASPPALRRGAQSFWRAAAAPGAEGWRVEHLRVELRASCDTPEGRWTASALLACVERPARGGRPPILLANAHVHLWPPSRLSPAAARRSVGATAFSQAAARLAADGWDVSWSPESGRLAWVARPLDGGLAPLAALRDLAGEVVAGLEPPGSQPPPGTPSMAAAIALLRGDGWAPSALGLGRRAVPLDGGGTADLALLLLGSSGERRATGRPLRAEASVTCWLPAVDGPAAVAAPDLRSLTARLRAAGYRRRTGGRGEGSQPVRFTRTVEARVTALASERSRLASIVPR